MKAAVFIAITLLSGAIAGAVLGTLNQLVVEPYIDAAIDIENQNAIASGELFDPNDYASYRIWQKTGGIVAGAVLGMSIGALFGAVFAYARPSVPGSSNKKKALMLAGIMGFVLFIVPALKYPANPPAVGDPETIYYRQSLYVAFLAISGFSALGAAVLYRKIGGNEAKKIIAPGIYAAIMIVGFIAMPPNPDQITAPMDLVTNFRVVSTLTMAIFWGLLGIVFGIFWDRLRPHESAKISTV
ncbi:MAG: CbtA family protein [Nitrososphaera sp.]